MHNHSGHIIGKSATNPVNGLHLHSSHEEGRTPAYEDVNAFRVVVVSEESFRKDCRAAIVPRNGVHH